MGIYLLPWIKGLFISLYSADSCASETNPKETQKIMTVNTNTDILSFTSHFSQFKALAIFKRSKSLQ